MDDEKTPQSNEPQAEDDDPVETAGGDLGQDIGVYLLDAATPDERAEFERAVEALPEVRAEAVQLAPAAAVLGKLYELTPDEAPEAYDLSVEPSAELRGRILASAWAERAAPPAAEAIEPTAPASQAAPPVRAIRPQGRVRGGAPATEPIPIRRKSLATPWMAAAALLVIAVGGVLWALALQNKIDNQNREMRAQSTEIAQIRANANASAYTLAATGNGPAQAKGMLYYSQKDQQAVLVLNQLPMPSNNSVYQLWYISGSNAPSPGATFKPDANGEEMMATTPGITSFDTVALTMEPAGGSTKPTMPILLVGSTKGTPG